MEPGPGDPVSSPETHPTHVITAGHVELASDNTCLTGFLLVLCIVMLSDVGFDIVAELNTSYEM
jgi:hypothetical protein